MKLIGTGLMAILLMGGCKIVNGKDIKTLSKQYAAPDSVTCVMNLTSATVIITEGTPSLSISGPEDMLERYSLKTDGNILTIYTKENPSALQYPISIGSGLQTDVIVKVSLPELKRVDSQGSGDITVSGFSIDNLEIGSQGSADIDVKQLTLNTLSISSSGSGDLDLSGIRADSISIFSQGSGDVEITGLKCGILECLLQGSGDIDIAGHAQKASVRGMGSGDINTRDLICPDIVKNDN